MMELHDSTRVTGFITKELYIKGKTLAEIERLLGFHPGRLRAGMYVAALKEIPEKNQFNLQGYSQVAEHRFDKTKALEGLDEDKLKQMAIETFTLTGINRLIKVRAVTGHNDLMSNDEQYPPGEGVPQWKLMAPLQAKVIAKVGPGERYL